MSKILLLNGTQPYPHAPGHLNKAFIERAEAWLTSRGHDVRHSAVADPYDIDEEIAKHQWADKVIVQFPVNWMGVPWSFKKYMDEVYSAGMDGRLGNGDGRSSTAPDENYGMGGVLTDTAYMLSVTFNAPRAAFDNPQDAFFKGQSVDDLLGHVHLTYRFLGLPQEATFAAHDVVKNPQIEADFARFEAHLAEVFEESAHVAA
ncbi:NAD(P)H-dependent oxidoreductase [Pseudoruegeria sp. SHC-113]|uniref:NAD(P)H-dependent oxidoreductase n=1 Tax=Pseudoruegeria sp. SHC-113 TaxID=2855439 RepID=UPI0021BB67A2|nr:NAD(P)H-dependent oxidoreductase [Pseudoruegeria sp. SHC-113]MCT8160070.1 NAD(P)H-dependent oxidoreductase [Pseudoruegeria sp. SHC-113]